ncbi:hypothetical protein ACFW9I_35715, partial [[Kitasatospora] papulosa]|uniref:hypothetical protein n=1 Tax=[Kitasatospora] papulosa TaxID=1464011 RepID=UPI00369E6043
LRRVVLHDHEMSVLRSAGSSVSCVQHQGSRPPLQLTRPGDIAVPLLADPFTAASVVLDHLMSLTAWPTATHERVRAYIAGGRRLGAELTEKLIAELRPVTGPAAPQPHALDVWPPAGSVVQGGAMSALRPGDITDEMIQAMDTAKHTAGQLTEGKP